MQHTTDEPIQRTTRHDKAKRRKVYAGKPTGPTHQEIRNQSKLDRPFISWDGEGYNDEQGHHYSLFGNSVGGRVEKPSLTWRDCITLLLESPKDAYHVIYAGTYDVVMMFRDTDIVEQLLTGEPTKLENYRLVFRKSKYLQVTDLNRKGDTNATRILFDVFTFFRQSFVATCREYGVGNTDLLEQVEAMKLQRNDFAGITPEIRQYMGRELDLLVELMDNFRERLALAGIYPAQWHGPGAIASTVLRKERINKCRGSYDDEFRQCAESAYYGGRFEQFQRGTYLGPVYQYDIRSAYPSAMTHLPDLSEVRWEHTTQAKEHNDYALYHVKVGRIATDTSIGSLPHRNRHGTILFPSWAYGWYWGIECAHIPIKYRREAWEPTGPGLRFRPFSFVQEDYRQRAILKAANQPQEKAIKLKLNSLYGKLAQSKGARKNDHQSDGTIIWRYPPFHEIVWAGWITAWTRRLISDAMHSVPVGTVIACETDGIFTTVPIPALSVGTGLGQWELTIADGIRYIQSGVSLILSKGEWAFKTRGFTVHKSIREVEIWANFLASPGATIGIRQTRFGTDPRAKKQFGKWYTMDRILSLVGGPLEKRHHVTCARCSAGETFDQSLHPMVIAHCEKGPSVPYKFVWRDYGAAQEMISDLFAYEGDPILDTEYV